MLITDPFFVSDVFGVPEVDLAAAAFGLAGVFFAGAAFGADVTVFGAAAFAAAFFGAGFLAAAAFFGAASAGDLVCGLHAPHAATSLRPRLAAFLSASSNVANAPCHSSASTLSGAPPTPLPLLQ
ncbi:MAG: hypothetical protein CMK07_00710 [Ponticaulis sp.]|nr:hypothetical protein [Ponticaulis sp.]